MRTTTFTLALAALAALSFASAQLAPVQSERVSASRANLELTINEADLMSFSIKASGGTMAAGGGGGAGKASFSDLSIMMSAGKATPKLAEAVAKGKHFPKAILTVRKAGKEQQEYYRIVLENAMITSFQTHVSSSGDRPMESLSLNFTKIEFDYKSQK